MFWLIIHFDVKVQEELEMKPIELGVKSYDSNE